MQESRNNRRYWIVTMLITMAVVTLFFFSPAVHAYGMPGSEDEQYLETFQQIFEFVQDNYVDDIDAQVLIEGALRGLFESLDDPYSTYLDSTDMRSLTDTTSGEFGGVGLYIRKITANETDPELKAWIEIISPIEDTPAFRKNLRPRDYITEIEGESTIDLSIDEVVNKLRGTPGTKVKVSILRNRKISLTVELTRATIEIPTVKYAGIQDDIGYVRILQFTPLTPQKVAEAFYNLQLEGYKDMVIDLRTNPGGLLNSAIETADLFFDDGLLVGTEGRKQAENRSYYAKKGMSLSPDAQIIVLINEGTASAAEILAGALKDRDRAVIVGKTSYGKGSVQQIREFNDSGFRLTMSKYYTPNKTFINKIGISPDIIEEGIQLTDEEEMDIAYIQEEMYIENFLDTHNNKPSESDTLSFLRDLEAMNLSTNTKVIRRLIKTEAEIRLNITSVFDIDYDKALQEAIKILLEDQTQIIIEDREPFVPASSVEDDSIQLQ